MKAVEGEWRQVDEVERQVKIASKRRHLISFAVIRGGFRHVPRGSAAK